MVIKRSQTGKTEIWENYVIADQRSSEEVESPGPQQQCPPDKFRERRLTNLWWKAVVSLVPLTFQIPNLLDLLMTMHWRWQTRLL